MDELCPVCGAYWACECPKPVNSPFNLLWGQSDPYVHTIRFGTPQLRSITDDEAFGNERTPSMEAAEQWERLEALRAARRAQLPPFFLVAEPIVPLPDPVQEGMATEQFLDLLRRSGISLQLNDPQPWLSLDEITALWERMARELPQWAEQIGRAFQGVFDVLAHVAESVDRLAAEIRKLGESCEDYRLSTFQPRISEWYRPRLLVPLLCAVPEQARAPPLSGTRGERGRLKISGKRSANLRGVRPVV